MVRLLLTVPGGLEDVAAAEVRDKIPDAILVSELLPGPTVQPPAGRACKPPPAAHETAVK